MASTDSPDSPRFEKVVYGTTDGTTILPIKVVSDGGSPALGKVVVTTE